MSDRIPRDDLSELGRRLAALRPASGGLDRDRMLFDAGRASARPEGRALVWTFSAAALLAVGLCLGLVRERSRALGLERALIAARETPPAPSVAPPPLAPSPPIEVAPDSYLALSRRAFASLDDPRPGPALPPVRPTPDRPPLPLRVRGSEGLRDL